MMIVPITIYDFTQLLLGKQFEQTKAKLFRYHILCS